MDPIDERALESSCRNATYEIRSARDRAVAEAAREVASGKAGVGNKFIGDILDAVKVAMDEAVNKLIADHIAAGQTDPVVVSTRIRSLISAEHPFSFPSSQHRNPGMEMRQQAEGRTRFLAIRDGLASRVPDLVSAALMHHRASDSNPLPAAQPGRILRRVSVTDAAIHVEAARPVHLGMLVLVGILGVAALVSGVYAVYKGATGDTSFEMWGAHLKTTSVGVAVAGMGTISVILVLRRILKSVEKLAALPREHR